MFAIIIGFLFLMGAIPALNSNEYLAIPLTLLGIVSSMLLTFLIYSWLMKKAVVWFKLEKHVPQLFKKRK
jgi:hypothetical protein